MCYVLGKRFTDQSFVCFSFFFFLLYSAFVYLFQVGDILLTPLANLQGVTFLV